PDDVYALSLHDALPISLQKEGFASADKNGDGFFTVDDMRLFTKTYLDAIDKEDFSVLDAWTKSSAGVSTPEGWFKDHFAHKPMRSEEHTSELQSRGHLV